MLVIVVVVVVVGIVVGIVELTIFIIALLNSDIYWLFHSNGRIKVGRQGPRTMTHDSGLLLLLLLIFGYTH